MNRTTLALLASLGALACATTTYSPDKEAWEAARGRLADPGVTQTSIGSGPLAVSFSEGDEVELLASRSKKGVTDTILRVNASPPRPEVKSEDPLVDVELAILDTTGRDIGASSQELLAHARETLGQGVKLENYDMSEGGRGARLAQALYERIAKDQPLPVQMTIHKLELDDTLGLPERVAIAGDRGQGNQELAPFAIEARHRTIASPTVLLKAMELEMITVKKGGGADPTRAYLRIWFQGSGVPEEIPITLHGDQTASIDGDFAGIGRIDATWRFPSDRLYVIKKDEVPQSTIPASVAALRADASRADDLERDGEITAVEAVLDPPSGFIWLVYHESGRRGDESVRVRMFEQPYPKAVSVVGLYEGDDPGLLQALFDFAVADSSQAAGFAELDRLEGFLKSVAGQRAAACRFDQATGNWEGRIPTLLPGSGAGAPGSSYVAHLFVLDTSTDEGPRTTLRLRWKGTDTWFWRNEERLESWSFAAPQ